MFKKNSKPENIHLYSKESMSIPYDEGFPKSNLHTLALYGTFF